MAQSSPAVPSPQAVPPRRRQALVLLDGGAKVDEVARAVGVSRRTLSRWRTGHAPAPSPAAEVLAVEVEQRRSTVEAATLRIAAESAAAVDVLVQIMKDPNAEPRDRLRAACEILDRGGLGKRTEPLPEPGARALSVSGLSAEIMALPAPSVQADRAAVLASVEARVAARSAGATGAGIDVAEFRAKIKRAHDAMERAESVRRLSPDRNGSGPVSDGG